MPQNALNFSDVDLSEFWEVWALLEERYVPPLDSERDEILREERLRGAINGLSYFREDPFTNFFPPNESKIFEENVLESEFHGIGAYVGIRDNTLTIISPLPDTPADLAGLKGKDKVLEIDEVSTEGFTAQDAVLLIRGEEGTVVKLKIFREETGETFDVDIERGNIEIPTVETELIDDVFVIKIYMFSQKLPSKFREAIEELIEADTNKVILDMRGNPGGLLSTAIHLASFFVDKGLPIVYQYSGSEDLKTYDSRGFKVFNKDVLNMVILLNGASASASEISAYAIRHYGGYKIVGTPSFGKGSVQELINLDGGSSLKVTTSHWLTPDKMAIDNIGIIPDVLVEIPEEQDDDVDYILEAGIELLNSGDYKVEDK